MALAQIPDPHRHGTDILVRTDAAGHTTGFLHHIHDLRQHDLSTYFSVGVPVTAPIRDALVHASAWIDALDTDGELRDGAQVVELTHLVAAEVLAVYPAGTRLIARRERPHPGAQLDLFGTVEGWRHQVIATDTPVSAGSIQYLEVRHRGHARVEDRIRCGKTTGLGRFPSRVFSINAAWLELALTSQDLPTWAQQLLLEGELARAEPRQLRYQLLHVAARITRDARRARLRIPRSGPGHPSWPPRSPAWPYSPDQRPDPAIHPVIPRPGHGKPRYQAGPSTCPPPARIDHHRHATGLKARSIARERPRLRRLSVHRIRTMTAVRPSHQHQCDTAVSVQDSNCSMTSRPE